MNSADQPSTAGIPQPGDVLVGKYRVERVLGVGGMGAVLAAMHLQLEERVAIKFLHAESARNPESVARFLREGKAVIKIRSEHAVKVHDVGKLDNGAPYLVMEHLDGDDLNTIVERHGPMPRTDAVDFVLQACEAIAEAHSIGIIHRDLKPANLFLTRRADGSPCVKVLDFGISKAVATGPDVGMTNTQQVMGSPRYMSPEQMRSTRAVDARTDVWSLGVILYELLTGAPPFNAQTMTELCAQILQDAPVPLVTLIPLLPASLDSVVLTCLGKEPDQRFPNLAALAKALAPFGTASAQASAARIVRVMQARAGAPSPPETMTVSASTFAPLADPALNAIGTDPTAVSASPQGTSSLRVDFGSSRPQGERSVGRWVVGAIAIAVLGAAALGLSFLRSHSAASGAPAVVAIAPVVPSPTPAPAPSIAQDPSATTGASTPVPASPSPSASPSPAAAVVNPATIPAKPPPRKHTSSAPSPPSASATAAATPAPAGMFDGRK